MQRLLKPRSYYRLPWSLTDNGISWLEVTTACNLACKGCYRDRNATGHKTLKEIEEELAVFKRERKSDCMSLAGGDPLVHPRILEIVKMVKEGGWKPIVNTNGLALTPKLLRDLKKAGVFGFTFHVDTSQKRTDCEALTEKEYNPLRQKFAEMLAEVGDIACSFNQTVTVDTIDQIPDVVRWAVKHPDIVHTMVFILFRAPRLTGEYDFYANGKKIDLVSTYDKTLWGGQRILKTQDVVDKIREVEPDFEPSAYLNGTVDPDSMKWTVGMRVASKNDTFGYVSPKFMEVVQQGNHLLKGKWISYSSPRFLGSAHLSAMALSPFDPGMRNVASKYFTTGFKKPTSFLKKAYMQAFTIIQPIDMLEDGQMNMCDGCPDITVHEGKLYWSCRLEEIKEHGCFVSAVPRGCQIQKTPDKTVHVPPKERPTKPEIQVTH